MENKSYKNIIFDVNNLNELREDKSKLARNFLRTLSDLTRAKPLDNDLRILFSGKSDFDLDGRLQLTKNYLENSYNFLNHATNSRNLNSLVLNWNNFRKLYQNEKCHKNREKAEKIDEIFHLNEKINKTGSFGRDFFLKLFLESFFVNLSLSQTETTLIQLRPQSTAKNDFNVYGGLNLEGSDHSDQSNIFESKIGLDSVENVKWKLITQISEQLIAYLLAITCSEQLSVDVKSFNVIIVYFLSFLREKGFFHENDKKLVSNKKNKVKTVYGFKFKYDSLDLPADFFYLEFCKYEPIIIKNSPLTSPEIKKDSYLLFFDVIFKWQIINRKNPNYGRFDGKLEEVIYDDIFDESLISANSTKFYFFKSQLKKLIKKFIKNNLSPEVDLFWDHSIENLIKYFKNYSIIDGVATKIMFSDILRLIYLKKYLLMLETQDFVYMPFFIDFRGRRYYNGVISPTNFKLMRFLIHFGLYTKEELRVVMERNIKSKSFGYLKKFFPYMEKHESSFSLLNGYQIDFDDKNYLKAIVINSLISIGILFKSEILKNKINEVANYEISIDEFFNLGLSKFLNSKTVNNCLSWEDELILERHFFIIDGNFDIYTKIPVSFDFSCSGHQINFLYATFENFNDYEKINITGFDKACDTYTYIINIFTETIKQLYCAQSNNKLNELYKLQPGLTKQNLIKLYEISLKNPDASFIQVDLKKTIKEYYTINLKHIFENERELSFLLESFTRSRLKRAIMTTQYNCSLRSFLDYTAVSFTTSEDRKYFKKNESKLNTLLKIFYHFCNNFNNFNRLRVLNDGDSLKILMQKNQYRWEFFDGFVVNFAYFRNSKKDSRITFYTKSDAGGAFVKRITTTEVSIDKIYCPSGTETSSMPNSTHSLDSSIVRVITLLEYLFCGNNNLFTIHDEFWVPVQNSFYFKDEVNCVVKIKLNQKINFSTFRTLEDLEKAKYLLVDDRLKDAYNFFVIW